MIYIVILAYNEASSLPGLILELNRILKTQQEIFQFVIVDDGSRDQTAQIAQSLAQELPLILLQHPINLGVAKAFDTGLRHVCEKSSAADFIVTLEGDKTNDPSCVPVMIQKLKEGSDVVCASRYQPGGAYVGFPWKRRLFSLGANTLARLFFRVPGVADYTIFFRAYRAPVLQRALRQYGTRFIECRGFASNAEILVKVVKAGAQKCSEIPTVYRYDLKPGKSKMRILENMKEYLLLFWRTFEQR